MLFYEYAVDPKLMSKWSKFRYFSEKFGWYYGRLISLYPKRWKKLVYKLIAPDCSEIERKRIEEGLSMIDDRIIKRPNAYFDNSKSWLENAINEHKKHERKAFRAILVYENPMIEYEFILSNDGENDKITDKTKLFVPPIQVVPRKADAFTSAVEFLLQSGKQIVLVDPYFDPNKDRFTKVFSSLINSIFNPDRRTTDPKIELHTSIERYFRENEERTPDEEKRVADHLLNTMQKRLPSLIQKDKKLQVVIWKQCPEEDKVHNRYIITDVGGVCFGTGLDEGPDGQTDDVNRMDPGQHKHRLSQYTSEEKRIWQLCTIEITGNPKKSR